MAVTKTVFNLSWRGLAKIIRVFEKIVENLIFSIIRLPKRGLQTARKMIGYVLNVYVLFWCLKALQKRVVDPLLELTIGMSTLNGWKNERTTRYIMDESTAPGTVKSDKQLDHTNNDARHVEPTLDQLKVSLP